MIGRLTSRRAPTFSNPDPMFLRLLYESFRAAERRKLLAGVAIMVGVGVATAMIAVATDIGEQRSAASCGLTAPT